MSHEAKIPIAIEIELNNSKVAIFGECCGCMKTCLGKSNNFHFITKKHVD